jgi:hypothetical protein
MHILLLRATALAAVLVVQPLRANANEIDADRSARTYFAEACADGNERVGVYAPATQSFTDITTGARARTFAWNQASFEELCALPQLYVYHCHTTADVLTQFPSGSESALSGDFASAAEMEFSCAKAATLDDHPVASLIYGVVTPRGEITKYGFTAPTADRLRAAGSTFGRLLKSGAPRAELERAQTEAQRIFGELNGEYFARFIRFAVKNCPDGAIERCNDFRIERFADTWSPDDRMFVRVDDTPAAEAKPTAANSHPSWERLSSVAGAIRVAQVGGDITELTPETLGGFVAEGKAMVSICSDAAEGLRPCRDARERMIRLTESCPRVRLAILDQDKHPKARFVYPTAKDRSLLLFKTNPQSGLNEQFDLTIMGEPTGQMIAMVLCGELLFKLPSFSQ